MWSAVVDNLVNAPRFAGPLDGATHEGLAGVPGEGPHFQLWLTIQEQEIVGAAYNTFGCLAAIASGEMLCLLLVGRSVEQAQQLTPELLTRAMQGLPEGKEHCPQLAISALHQALSAKCKDDTCQNGEIAA